MDYREFITGFSEESLKKVVIYVAVNLFNTNRTLVNDSGRGFVNNALSKDENLDRQISYFPNGYVAQYVKESRDNPHFSAVFELLNKRRKSNYINWLVSNLGNVNDATIKVEVEKLSKSSAQFNSASSLRCALILSQIPEEEIREVALTYNIDITNTKRSGFFGSFSGGANWSLVERVTKHIVGGQPAEYQRYSTFCTTCEKESPDGADHCIHCGLLLPLNVCPNCQTRNIKVAKFCMGCGQVR